MQIQGLYHRQQEQQGQGGAGVWKVTDPTTDSLPSIIPGLTPCLSSVEEISPPVKAALPNAISFSLYDASDSCSLLLDDDFLAFEPLLASTPKKSKQHRPVPCEDGSNHNLIPEVNNHGSDFQHEQHETLKVDPILFSNKKSKALLVGPIEYSSVIRDKWPYPTGIANRASSIHMNIYQKVRSTNLPNYLSARIPIPSGLDCDAWDALLSDYQDKELCQFLRYGWPSNYTAPSPPVSSQKNHPSALAHMAEIDRFIDKELSKGALLGPFVSPPFAPWSQTSPLMTAEKKDSLHRRVIIDLSYPEGQSVNAGVAKNFFQGAYTSYNLPTVHDLAQKIISLGPGTLLWKTDLERAYRQLRSDPLDYPLMGIVHRGAFFTDICPSFGCRGSSAAQQRVSAAVCHLMATCGHAVLAYIDDFCGAHASFPEAACAFAEFEALCEILGLKIAPEKSAYPSTTMEWLGFEFNTVDMQITIPQDKLREVLALMDTWTTRSHATRRDLQVLAGTLNHIALCILPARRFMARILTNLRSAPQTGWVRIDEEARRDIAWFVKYAEASNGRVLLQPTLHKLCLECDACLEGGGGFSPTHYYSVRFPLEWMVKHHISRLEALNVIIAIKSLIPDDLHSTEVVIKTDNIAAAYSLTTGRAKDPILASCARELWLIAATRQLTITVEHAPGETLVLADALSRRHKSPDYDSFIIKTVHDLNIMPTEPVHFDHVLTPGL